MVSLAAASLATASLAFAPANDPTARPDARPDARTVERLAALAELYAAVEFFHPDVASEPVARAAWNEAMAVAVETVAHGDATVFEPAIRRLVSSIRDSMTTVIGAFDRTPVGAMEGVERRALRYSGFPPQVQNRYGGGYRPFAITWDVVPDSAVDLYRVDLPEQIAALVRFTEPLPAGAAPGDDVSSEGSDEVTGAAAAPADSAATDPAYPRAGARVIAAYRLRAVARYFHPYTELSETDWDAALREAIPGLLAAHDSTEYALAVAELAAGFDDSHVGLQGPGWSAAVDGPRAPVGVRILASGEAVITGFATDSVRRVSGLSRGDVLLAIDGIPVADRIDSLARFRAVSTPQALREKIRMDMLGRGDEGSRVTLRVRRAGGEIVEVDVGRTSDGWWGAFAAPRLAEPAVRFLAEDIGYVDLTRLERSEVDSAFSALADARAIVLDMRGYPRGTAWSIAPRLVRETGVITSRIWTRIAASPDPEAVALEWTEAEVPEDPEVQDYAGFTLMLIDGSAVSQAEFSGMMFRAANETLFVGEPTNGANGDVTDIALPGRLRMSFSGNGVEWPNGRRLQRRGLVPDFPAVVTLDGVRAGRDEALERALAIIDAADPHEVADAASTP
jgi:C-terminal processing protease CtpA/Prc